MRLYRGMVSAIRLCIMVAIAGLAARAQQDKPPSAIPPGFHVEGSWNCAGAFGNGKTHRSTMTGAVVVGAKWLELTEQDIEPATGYLAKYLIGYDAQQKRLVEFDANNFSAATYTSAEGWQNGVLAMTSAIDNNPKAPYAANRFLFSVVNPDAFTMDWQISRTAQLNWAPGDHLVCKRGSQS